MEQIIRRSIETKQKLERTNVAATKDKRYLFNICLCYYFLYAENNSGVVLRLPQKRKNSTNHIITIELLKTMQGILYDKDKQYKKKVIGTKVELEYDSKTTLPIIIGDHPLNSKKAENANKSVVSAVLLDRLHQTDLFNQIYDNFWKCYIQEEERNIFDYSQIVNMPFLANSDHPGKRLTPEKYIRFVDKKDYLQEDGEIILMSFLEQFQSCPNTTNPIYLVIADSEKDRQMLIKEMISKTHERNNYVCLTRTEMISTIEMNLIQKNYPSFMVEDKVPKSYNSSSTTTSILMSEENQPNLTAFQPCSKQFYTVYQGYDFPIIPINPFAN